MHEIKAMITAFGTGIGDDFDISKASLRQDHHYDRCRCRWCTYCYTAVDIFISIYAGADQTGSCLSGAAASCIKSKKIKSPVMHTAMKN